MQLLDKASVRKKFFVCCEYISVYIYVFYFKNGCKFDLFYNEGNIWKNIYPIGIIEYSTLKCAVALYFYIFILSIYLRIQARRGIHFFVLNTSFRYIVFYRLVNF